MLWDEVSAWLAKAEQDLRAAHVLIRHEEAVLEPACFHCQQAAEKVLKAYLVSRGVRFEKVHSLSYLLDLCEKEEPSFAAIRPPAETLAPYAVDIRYPGEPAAMLIEEAEEALSSANTVWRHTLNYLSVQNE